MERLFGQLNLAGEVRSMTPGYHCEVVLHVLDGRERIIKTIRGHPSMDTPVAERLARDIVSYQQLLSDMGVPIPRERDCFLLEHQETQTTSVVLTESYEGRDAEDCLARMDAETARPLVREILWAIGPVLGTRGASRDLLVGVDPKPSNFAVSGAATYIDTVPPRYRRDGETLVDLPVPTHPDAWNLAYWRAYTPAGVLTVLLTQLCRVRPDLLTVFVEETKAAASACCIGECFERLPSSVFPALSTDERKAFVQRLEPTDMYLMRDAACFLAHEGPQRFDQRWLDTVFKRSHFKGGVSSDGFEHLKGELVGAL